MKFNVKLANEHARISAVIVKMPLNNLNFYVTFICTVFDFVCSGVFLRIWLSYGSSTVTSRELNCTATNEKGNYHGEFSPAFLLKKKWNVHKMCQEYRQSLRQQIGIGFYRFHDIREEFSLNLDLSTQFFMTAVSFKSWPSILLTTTNKYKRTLID